MSEKIPDSALLRAIVESSEDAIVGQDLEGRITFWNPGAARMFGYTSAEVLGQAGEILIPVERKDEDRDVRHRAASGERVQHFETVRKDKDGRVIDVALMVSPIQDARGNLIGVSHMLRNVGEQRAIERHALHLAALVASSEDAIASKDLDGVVQSWNPAAERMFGFTAAEMIGRSIRLIVPAERWAEEDLERDRNRLGAIVDSSDDAIISKDLNGIIQTWNRAAERMFGYTAEEMIGRSITTIIPEDRLSEETEVLGRIRRGLRVDHFDTLRRRKDGSLIPISLTVSPIYDGAGEIVGASKTARDLSALRNYATTLEQTVRERTAALEAANSQLEAFAYSVSHDLRAPLRGMHGLAHALLEDYGSALDERAREYATRIVSEATYLDQLIQDLLAYSRLTRIDVALEAVDVREIVDAALHVLEPDLEKAHASIEIEPNLPRLKANRAVLTQVLTNLISNAIKFGGSAPRIRIRAQNEDGKARIWVEDRGIGIASKYHDRIFLAFERLHGVERYPGTGIGLAIVHKGIERLGGRVGVESEEGHGSRFWFELARAEAA